MILRPVPDAHQGGGDGPAFLELLPDGIRTHVHPHFRTQTERTSRGILRSSMGGLFSLFPAWTRPDLFRKAACLSSSFWWGDRWAVKHVQSSEPPEPRPLFYIDSGASPGPLEEGHSSDNFHDTRSMLRALKRVGFNAGADVHRLVFPGQSHHAAAWASRVALPLQLLFPHVTSPFDFERWQGQRHILPWGVPSPYPAAVCTPTSARS